MARRGAEKLDLLYEQITRTDIVAFSSSPDELCLPKPLSRLATKGQAVAAGVDERLKKVGFHGRTPGGKRGEG